MVELDGDCLASPASPACLLHLPACFTWLHASARQWPDSPAWSSPVSSLHLLPATKFLRLTLLLSEEYTGANLCSKGSRSSASSVPSPHQDLLHVFSPSMFTSPVSLCSATSKAMRF
ncbi:hypothetical protein F2Q69_00063949 [Brassica cretica]|uniref:Uncharacterized protein n=1 Tax=Brassica cretica TaxID=69181 RepID=A0A8S9PGZ2_BRACR|nr:hypothetical protein F2Q69_00063949 [Brassica cretica]